MAENKKDEKKEPQKYEFKCTCGACTVEINGDMKFSGYCHCNECRVARQCVILHAVVFSPDDVKITKGEDNVTKFKVRDTRINSFCTKCGYLLFNKNKMGLLLFSAAQFMSSDMNDKEYAKLPKELAPQCHIYYKERCTDSANKDGLPKYMDVPKAFGGTDAMYGDQK
eukprot:446093_1